MMKKIFTILMLLLVLIGGSQRVFAASGDKDDFCSRAEWFKNFEIAKRDFLLNYKKAEDAIRSIGKQIDVIDKLLKESQDRMVGLYREITILEKKALSAPTLVEREEYLRLISQSWDFIGDYAQKIREKAAERENLEKQLEGHMKTVQMFKSRSVVLAKILKDKLKKWGLDMGFQGGGVWMKRSISGAMAKVTVAASKCASGLFYIGKRFVGPGLTVADIALHLDELQRQYDDMAASAARNGDNQAELLYAFLTDVLGSTFDLGIEGRLNIRNILMDTSHYVIKNADGRVIDIKMVEQLDPVACVEREGSNCYLLELTPAAACLRLPPTAELDGPTCKKPAVPTTGGSTDGSTGDEGGCYDADGDGECDI